jgi:hypothetical protein
MRIELHLGVHKTATTSLQRYWMRCADVRGGAVACPPLMEVRAELTPACHLGGPRNKPTDGPARMRAAAAWLDKQAHLAQTLVLSEENLIGSCERIFAQNALYAGALPRLQRLAELLQGHELRVWLSVREYGDFVRSAYCETLRHGPYLPFREVYGGLDLAQRGWEHVVQDVLSAFPGVPVLCWRYEALEQLRPAISAAMVGTKVADLPEPDPQRDRQSFSRMAIRLLDDLYERVGPDEATRARPSVERIVAGANMPSFEPWSTEEREQLRLAYERSIAAIRQLPRVNWLG